MHTFIGVYSQNELSAIKFAKVPFSLIVNLDYNQESGSHWLVIHICKDTIEIFDSLGLNFMYFKHYPQLIINFIFKFSFNRHVLCSPVLQPPTSRLCGLYSVYFILARQTKSFEKCLKPFGSNLYENDKKLIQYFNK